MTRAEPSAEQSAEPSADTAGSSPAVDGGWAKMEQAEIQNRRAAPLIRCSGEMTHFQLSNRPLTGCTARFLICGYLADHSQRRS